MPKSMNVRVTPNLDDGVCKISAVLHSLLGLFLNLQLICEPGTNGPRREKTCLRGFRQGEFQTSLLGYRD